MADVTLPGSGSIVATDSVGSRQFQAVKIDIGSAGVSLPLIAYTTIPDNTSPSIAVRVIGQDITQVSFTDTGSGVVTQQMTMLRTGAGIGVSQSISNLTVTTGTTANADFLARSNTKWRGSWLNKFKMILSQRIANNNFMCLMGDLVADTASFTVNSSTSITVTKVAHGFTANNIGQFMFIGGMTLAACPPNKFAIASIPSVDTITFTVAGWPASGSGTLTLFGWNHSKILYNGTTATASAFDTSRQGWPLGDTAISTFSTVSPGHVMQTHLDGRDVYIGDTLTASTTTPNITSRGSRIESMPDDNVDLYFFIWVYNGTTAPASSTTMTIGFWSVEKFANTPVYIAGSRMQGTAPPIPVSFATTQSVSVAGSLTVSSSTPAAPTTTFVNSTASTNATSVKSSTGTIYSIIASNTNASARYVKFYNLATAPTVGTSTPTFTMAIPSSGTVMFDTGATGMRFSAGIALAITGAAADTDTTVTAANDVKVAISFI